MRTCTVMTFTDGKTSHFAVMHGPMKGRAFNSHKADIVGRYTVEKPATPDYAAMTAKHATKTAPAVRWQARQAV